MMRQRKVIVSITAFYLAVVMLAASGCSERITNPDRGVPVTIAVDCKGLAPSAVAAVDHFLLLVEGKDFGSIVVPMAFDNGALQAQVNVPAGRARRFVVRGLDAAETVLYQGETMFDVFPRTKTSLEITLLPVVPLMNLTPHMLSLPMTTGFTLDLNVFRIDSLASVSFDLDYSTVDNIVILDSIIIAPELDSIAVVEIATAVTGRTPGFQSLLATIHSLSPMVSMVNAAGNAHLATCYFSTIENTLFNADTAFIRATPYFLKKAVPSLDQLDTIPVSSIFIDGASVELYRRPTWARTFGGDLIDDGYSLIQTTDGGYVITGFTGMVPQDLVYLLKTDRWGRLMWEKYFDVGNGQYNYGRCVAQTIDGGLIVTGSTQSVGAETDDVVLLKTDRQGNLLWSRSFGGGNYEIGNGITPAAGGGYFIAGATSSFGAGGLDAYLIKTDDTGGVVWQKTFGGISDDYAFTVVATGDGGCVTAGWTASSGNGYGDVFVVRTDAGGAKVWEKTFGGDAKDIGYALAATPDGGFLVVGSTYSFGAGMSDVFLLRLNASGDLAWQRTYGGMDDDDGYALTVLPDGSCTVAGSTTSSGAGGSDLYLLKVGPTGNLIWQRNIGGPGNEIGRSVIFSSDDYYVAAGMACTDIYLCDLYLVKVNNEGQLLTR
jgi:hypothetical protein